MEAVALKWITFPRSRALRGRRKLPVRATSTSQSEFRERRPQNVEGEFFVDRRCIDCDTCRWMARVHPSARETFTRIGGQSAVFKQPSSEEDLMKALQALLCCPTNSIRTENPRSDVLEAQKSNPNPIDKTIPGIYHCGYHSERSYGATSYLIVHPEGNILVDSPRYIERLARDVEKLGGARYMFLTHKDVGDHEMWSRRLRCERILHSTDVEVSTADVEMQPYGDGPWSIGKDFELIHTPGHSEGSVCLFYKPLKVLFTGDHLANSEEDKLSIFEQYNSFSVKMQLENVWKFLDLEFVWILPGHGRKIKFRDTEEKNSTLVTFLASKGHQFPSI